MRDIVRDIVRDIIDHVIKDSIVIGCAFSQSGKVTICAFDSILRPLVKMLDNRDLNCNDFLNTLE